MLSPCSCIFLFPLLDPDKNPDRKQEALHRFQLIQEAFACLNDPQERAFYDAHRIAILSDFDPSTAESKDLQLGVNLYPFFSSSGFSGFNDGPLGFFTVYSDLFAKIDQLERDDADDERDQQDCSDSEEPPLPSSSSSSTSCCSSADDVDEGPAASQPSPSFRPQPYISSPPSASASASVSVSVSSAPSATAPSLGTSSSCWDDVHAFYSFWAGYSTRRSFAWCDKWKLRDAPNRRTRAIQKENLKERELHRREFNDLVL